MPGRLWSESLSMAAVEIDRQHRDLFGVAEQLRANVRQSGPEGERRELLLRLAEVASSHFETEEQLMREARYPRLEQHQREHNTFRLWLERALQAGPSEAMGDWLPILEHWLVRHVATSDRDYLPYLESEGLVPPSSGRIPIK